MTDSPLNCYVCGRPLDANEEPWQAGLDGDGAHVSCLQTPDLEEEDDYGE